MGESVIGAILFQTVFDTAAMDFYTVLGLCGSWLVWFLACVWLWMKWTLVLSSCHIVFVVRSDHFIEKVGPRPHQHLTFLSSYSLCNGFVFDTQRIYYLNY